MGFWETIKGWVTSENDYSIDAMITDEELADGQITDQEIIDGQLTEYEMEQIEQEAGDPFGITHEPENFSVEEKSDDYDLNPVDDWFDL